MCYDLCIGGGIEYVPPSLHLLPELGGIDQIAVMRYGNGPILELDQKRLAVFYAGAARCWIAHMPDAHTPAQECDLGIIEDL